MDKFLMSLKILAIFIIPVLIYAIIKKIISSHQRTCNRISSAIKCGYCGASMLEEDVFCQSCQKISPKVREMLRNHPDKKTNSYHSLDNGYNERCPHCKALYARGSNRYSNMSLKSPIICCSNCHGYFIDICNAEWSVLPPLKKFKHFFLIYIWGLVALWFYQVSFFSGAGWILLPDFALYTAGHFVFCLIWHYTIRRNKVRQSNMRLEQNPEYPQILIDMGYWKMMSKEHHHLSKEPIPSRSDKFLKIKEFLKDAFTLD